MTSPATYHSRSSGLRNASQSEYNAPDRGERSPIFSVRNVVRLPLVHPREMTGSYCVDRTKRQRCKCLESSRHSRRCSWLGREFELDYGERPSRTAECMMGGADDAD